jgi:ABC-2 type transport system ATP-binding protein
MKQAAKLAQAIAHGPKLLFLDETHQRAGPAGAHPHDPTDQEIRDRGDLHLILSSHLLRDVEECCDQVLILKDGNIAAFCNLEEERRRIAGFWSWKRAAASTEVFWRGSKLGCETATGRRAVPNWCCPMGWRCGSCMRSPRARTSRSAV